MCARSQTSSLPVSVLTIKIVMEKKEKRRSKSDFPGKQHDERSGYPQT